MDQYLLDDYRRKQDNHEKRVEKTKRKRAIELFDQGLRDIGVMAEALETTENTIKSYLGKTRTNICLGIIEENSEEAQIIRKDRKKKKAKTTKPKNESQKPKRFTEKDAENYSKERDSEIKMYYGILSVEQIADKLHMSKNQVEERLMAMGLLLYNSSEIEKMREEARRKADRSTPQKSKPKKEVQSPEETEKSSSTSGKIGKAEDKPTQGSSREEIGSFDELKKIIRRLIRDRKSKKAMILARTYSRYADFLSDDERKRLTGMADTIELLRAKESGKKTKER